jgi:hypothetical protein
MTPVTWPLLTASRLELLHAKFAPLLGRGLERHFRVLFSAIFHAVPRGKCHQRGKQWKLAEAKLLQVYLHFLHWLYR